MKAPFRVQTIRDAIEDHSTQVYQLVLLWVLVLEVSYTENTYIQQVAFSVRISGFELGITVSGHANLIP